MKEDLIVGNWKMYKGPSEAAAFVGALLPRVAEASCQVMVAPPFVSLPAVGALVNSSKIGLVAQNMGPALSGAHTGEVSPEMLKELGVQAVILGHSERRHLYRESDQLINEKLLLALEQGLKAVLCIGETLQERKEGRIEEVCFGQINAGLAGVKQEALSQVILAYEPVWAIGTGQTATPDDANAVHAACRENLARLFSQEQAKRMRILYGGSVKPENIGALMAMPHINGGLVGGASLSIESFVALTRY